MNGYNCGKGVNGGCCGDPAFCANLQRLMEMTPEQIEAVKQDFREPKPTGAPILYLVGEQVYSDGATRECRIRIDVELFLSHHARGRILEREAYDILARLGVKL